MGGGKARVVGIEEEIKVCDLKRIRFSASHLG